jgi:hypothetical protein
VSSPIGRDLQKPGDLKKRKSARMTDLWLGIVDAESTRECVESVKNKIMGEGGVGKLDCLVTNSGWIGSFMHRKYGRKAEFSIFYSSRFMLLHLSYLSWLG